MWLWGACRIFYCSNSKISLRIVLKSFELILNHEQNLDPLRISEILRACSVALLTQVFSDPSKQAWIELFSRSRYSFEFHWRCFPLKLPHNFNNLQLTNRNMSIIFTVVSSSSNQTRSLTRPGISRKSHFSLVIHHQRTDTRQCCTTTCR